MNEEKLPINSLNIRRSLNGFIISLHSRMGMMSDGEYVALTVEQLGEMVKLIFSDEKH